MQGRKPPKIPDPIPSTNSSNANRFDAMGSYDQSHLPPADSKAVTDLQEALSKTPILPEHTAKNYKSVTSAKHANIAYDPLTHTTTDIATNKQRTYKSSDPIGFILADQPMPGAVKPAAARKHRFDEALMKHNVLTDNSNKMHTICFGHGGVVKVELLQTDHAHSASDILKNQIKLVESLNQNTDIAKIYIDKFKLNDLFVKVGGKYQGTLYFYESYYNDIENLWNICQSCNLRKTNANPLDWFEKNEHFGAAFKAHLEKLNVDTIGLTISADGKGLAEIAIDWYREKNKSTIETMIKLHHEIVFKIDADLQKALIATGLGESIKAEGYNARAMLTTSLTSLTANTKINVHIEGITPPSSPDSTQMSSDDNIGIVKATPSQVINFASSITPNSTVALTLGKEMDRKVREGLTNQPAQTPLAISEINRENLFEHYSNKAAEHKSEYEKHKEQYEHFLKLAEEHAPIRAITSDESITMLPSITSTNQAFFQPTVSSSSEVDNFENSQNVPQAPSFKRKTIPDSSPIEMQTLITPLSSVQVYGDSSSIEGALTQHQSHLSSSTGSSSRTPELKNDLSSSKRIKVKPASIEETSPTDQSKDTRSVSSSNLTNMELDDKSTLTDESSIKPRSGGRK